MHCSKIALASLFLTVIIGCASELLPELELLEISISEGYIDAGSLSDIRLVFSQKPKKSSVENSFTLLANGFLESGSFFYSNNTVQFIPENRFKENVDYELTISQNVETINGCSLDKKYCKKFTTRKELEPPIILSLYPSNGEIVSPEIGEMEIEFSEPIDPDCINDAIEITPSVDYLHAIDEGGCVLKLIPKKNLRLNTVYILTVNQNLIDCCANSLASPYKIYFKTGIDMTPPDYSIFFSYDDNDSIRLQENCETFIANNAKIDLVFNEKISEASLGSRIYFDPPINTSTTCNAETLKDVSIIFSTRPPWQYSGALIVEKGISDIAGNKIRDSRRYPVAFTMEEFRPVTVLAAFLETGIQNELSCIEPKRNYSDLIFPAERFPQHETISTVVYFVASVSNNAQTISYISAMKGIEIAATNMCVIIRMCSMDILSWDDKVLEPFRELAASYSDETFSDKKRIVIRINLEVENRLERGIVEWSVTDLQDDLGNTIDSVWQVFMNKG